jgi:hypothetical protein
MSAEAPSSTVEDVLAWEAQHRPRAATAALLAGIFLILGTVITGVALRHVPQVTLLDALRDAAGVPPADGGLRTGVALYFHDHALALTIGQVVLGLGGLLAAAALLYLFLAVRARKPDVTQVALGALATGGIAYLVGTLVRQIARDVSLSSFASAADHSTAAAHKALEPSAFIAGSLIQIIGQLALAIGFIVVSLNAMRVGLLTRFMGILGVLSGLLFVLQITSLPVVQAFWLAALGALILERWPTGIPPAWHTGRAEPWPSRQQMIEARGGAAAAPGPVVASDDAGVDVTPSPPRSKKKKRRR